MIDPSLGVVVGSDRLCDILADFALMTDSILVYFLVDSKSAIRPFADLDSTGGLLADLVLTSHQIIKSYSAINVSSSYSLFESSKVTY